ncbi:MAG: hypothetical protein ACOYH4_06565 [Saccharofermentanales bacterium]|jgi:hypothetical protein
MAAPINITRAALAVLRKMIAADKANQYRNDTDVTFTLSLLTPAYQDDLWIFDPIPEQGITRVMLRAYGGPAEEGGKVICDGASYASDKPKGVLPASGLHDPGYVSLGPIVAAWQHEPYEPGANFKRDWVTRLTTPRRYPTWTAADVRQLWDAIFGAAIRAGGGHSFIVRTYYSGVRWAGGIWRAIKKRRTPLIIAISLATMLAGCNGCMVPPDIADFDNLPDMIPIERDY